MSICPYVFCVLCSYVFCVICSSFCFPDCTDPDILAVLLSMTFILILILDPGCGSRCGSSGPQRSRSRARRRRRCEASWRWPGASCRGVRVRRGKAGCTADMGNSCFDRDRDRSNWFDHQRYHYVKRAHMLANILRYGPIMGDI